jgi:putative intracellular protease/amidase
LRRSSRLIVEGDRVIKQAILRRLNPCPGQNWTLITSRNPDDIPAFNEAISQALLAT